jgi:hypothetical protein
MDLDDELQRAVVELAGARRPVAAAAEPYDFASLGETIAASIVQAAEEQVRQAEASLEHARRFAEELRAQVAAKGSELADLNARLRQFGETVLAAHQAFNGRGS